MDQPQSMAGERRRFSNRDKMALLLGYLSVVPVAVVLFGGLGSSSDLVVAVVSGLAIVAAGYSLSWGTEALQFVVSQVLALAALAVVQVLPEYSIEGFLAYRGALNPAIIHYATASMTGANRLLLGIGWPSVVIIAYVMSRRKGTGAQTWVKLDKSQSPAVFFLLVATLYSFVIVLREDLSPVDGVVLVAIYGLYLFVAHRIAPREEEALEELEGPAFGIASMSGKWRAGAIASLLLLGSVLILIAAAPFVNSILALGASLGIGPYLFVQWVAPFLTELPEGITALNWASRVSQAPMAIANLVSSKVNQWTLLLATIPIVYSVTLSGFNSIQLTGLQDEEIFITAAQSLYGAVCLFDMKLEMKQAAALLGLFLLQFLVPPLRIEVGIAYLALAAVEFVASYHRVELFSDLRQALRPPRK